MISVLFSGNENIKAEIEPFAMNKVRRALQIDTLISWEDEHV